MSWEVKGMRELQEKLDQLGAVAGLKILAAASRRAMQPIEEQAKALAPVKKTPFTGRRASEPLGLLRDSIRLAVQKPKAGNVVVSTGLTFKKRVDNEIQFADGSSLKVKIKGAGARWHWAEFGIASRGIAAHPFLRPAFHSGYSRAVELLARELRKSIDRAVRKQLKADGG